MKVFKSTEAIRRDMDAGLRQTAFVLGDCVIACDLPQGAGLRLEVSGDLYVDSRADVFKGNEINYRGAIHIAGLIFEAEGRQLV